MGFPSIPFYAWKPKYVCDWCYKKTPTYRVHKSIIDWIYGVVFANVTFSLKEDWSSVEAIISPEYGKSPFTISFHQGPIDGRGATMPRQKRRVVTDAFVFGVIDDPSRWNGNNQWQTLLFDLSGWEQGCMMSGKQHLAYICENRRILHRSNKKDKSSFSGSKYLHVWNKSPYRL